MISKELLSEVLKEDLHRISRIDQVANCIHYKIYNNFFEDTCYAVNIYEFVHLNLKQWANFKNVFNIIDWSGEPEEIIAKAEEIMNEIN